MKTVKITCKIHSYRTNRVLAEVILPCYWEHEATKENIINYGRQIKEFVNTLYPETSNYIRFYTVDGVYDWEFDHIISYK